MELSISFCFFVPFSAKSFTVTASSDEPFALEPPAWISISVGNVIFDDASGFGVFADELVVDGFTDFFIAVKLLCFGVAPFLIVEALSFDVADDTCADESPLWLRVALFLTAKPFSFDNTLVFDAFADELVLDGFNDLFTVMELLRIFDDASEFCVFADELVLDGFTDLFATVELICLGVPPFLIVEAFSFDLAKDTGTDESLLWLRVAHFLIDGKLSFDDAAKDTGTDVVTLP